MAKQKKPNPYAVKKVVTIKVSRKKRGVYRPEPLAVSSYYEEKTLQEVCGGKCLKPDTVFDKLKDEPSELAIAKTRGSVTLANNAPAPRDLPDDWKGEIDMKRIGL